MAQEPALSRGGLACPTGDRVFHAIASFANLWSAAQRAALGKRSRPDVAAFLCALEPQVLRLERELSNGAWWPSGYRTFKVHEPKERVICAAPFRDRVVHQAIVQVVEPIFERAFIHDSYASRKGKGTHRAVDRVASWTRRYRWALRLDVQKYFPSIDHEVALARLGRRLHCARTLELFARILASWTSTEAPVHWFAGDDLFTPVRRQRGLPIGNLTSQFLANVVLDGVDHAAKDGLGLRAYARYCDDFVALADDPDELRAVRRRLLHEMGALRLRCHPHKSHLFPVQQGVPWLGYVVYRDRIELRSAAVPALRRRLRAFAHRVQRDPAARAFVTESLTAARGCLSASRLAQRILAAREGLPHRCASRFPRPPLRR